MDKDKIYFRAINDAPDKFANLTDTQTSVLFRLIFLLPFTGNYSGKSLYRAAKTLGRDRDNLRKQVNAILEWQDNNQCYYLDYNPEKGKGLRLIVDPENTKVGMRYQKPLEVMTTSIRGNGYLEKRGIHDLENIQKRGKSSASVRTEPITNRNKNQNQQQKGAAGNSLLISDKVVDSVLSHNREEKRNGTN